MPRIRSIKPEFYQDEKLSPLPAIDRLVFLGLIGMADDHGRIVDSVRLINGFIFPHTLEDAGPSLETLAKLGVIARGLTASGQSIIQIAKWHEHQVINKPNYAAALPPIVGTEPPSRRAPERVTESSGSDRGTISTISDLRSGSDDRDEERALSKSALHPRREKAPPKAPKSGLPADRSEAELAQDRKIAHADERRRHLKARAWADEHPDELEKIERQIDRELARTKAGPMRDEIRRGRLVAELLRRAEGRPPPAHTQDDPVPAGAYG